MDELGAQLDGKGCKFIREHADDAFEGEGEGIQINLLADLQDALHDTSQGCGDGLLHLLKVEDGGEGEGGLDTHREGVIDIKEALDDGLEEGHDIGGIGELEFGLVPK